MKINKSINRTEDNNKLIDIIISYINNNPDIRFHQALINLNITLEDSLYYEEPSETIERVNFSLINNSLNKENN